MSRPSRLLPAAALALCAASGCAKQEEPSNKAVTAVELPPTAAPEARAGSAATRKTQQVEPPAGITITPPPADAVKTPDGLVFKSLEEGKGPAPSKNDTVTLELTTWSSKGDTMASTKLHGGKPVPVALAPNSSVGFVEAITMMKKGGHAIFWVPPEIGHKGKGPAAAHSDAVDTLAFEVKLVDIKPAPAIPPDVAAPPATAQKTPKGVSFVVLKPGTGKDTLRYFDTAQYQYTGWDTTGHMFDSSEMRAQPRMANPFHESVGLEEALTQLVVGERARFWIPTELTKGGAEVPEGPLTYEIELVSIKPAAKVPPPVPADVAAPPKDAEKTTSGVFYKVLKPGDGKSHPAPTDTVTVNYTGWTTDGRLFDSSYLKGDPTPLPLTNVIKGWTDGIPTMTIGGTTRFWIPVELAYNHAKGKPDGMLVFDVELVSFSQGPPPGGPPMGMHHGMGMPGGHP
jgi:peptidylprolyl isomerase